MNGYDRQSSRSSTTTRASQDIDFDAEHDSGRANRVADMLTRRYVQKRATSGVSLEATHAAADRGTSQATTALPHADKIQNSFGPAFDVSGIQAHVGGDSAQAMGASAYASGNHVVFDKQPDLHTAAHEAAHVVQQARGVNLYGGVGEAGDSYEKHADAVADRVVAGQSAADLLSQHAGGSSTQAIQKEEGEAEGQVPASVTELRAKGHEATAASLIASINLATHRLCDLRRGNVDVHDDAKIAHAVGIEILSIVSMITPAVIEAISNKKPVAEALDHLAVQVVQLKPTLGSSYGLTASRLLGSMISFGAKFVDAEKRPDELYSGGTATAEATALKANADALSLLALEMDKTSSLGAGNAVIGRAMANVHELVVLCPDPATKKKHHTLFHQAADAVAAIRTGAARHPDLSDKVQQLENQVHDFPGYRSR